MERATLLADGAAAPASDLAVTVAGSMASGYSAEASGCSLWQLHGRSTARQPPGANAGVAAEADLGCFHALVLTDSLAAKPGRGYLFFWQR